MKEATKVTMEITKEGWTRTVYSGDEVVAQRRMNLESAGCARADKKGDFYDDLEDEELAEVVDELEGFDVARTLYFG